MSVETAQNLQELDIVSLKKVKKEMALKRKKTQSFGRPSHRTLMVTWNIDWVQCVPHLPLSHGPPDLLRTIWQRLPGFNDFMCLFRTIWTVAKFRMSLQTYFRPTFNLALRLSLTSTLRWSDLLLMENCGNNVSPYDLCFFSPELCKKTGAKILSAVLSKFRSWSQMWIIISPMPPCESFIIRINFAYRISLKVMICLIRIAYRVAGLAPWLDGLLASRINKIYLTQPLFGYLHA